MNTWRKIEEKWKKKAYTTCPYTCTVKIFTRSYVLEASEREGALESEGKLDIEWDRMRLARAQPFGAIKLIANTHSIYCVYVLCTTVPSRSNLFSFVFGCYHTLNNETHAHTEYT